MKIIKIMNEFMHSPLWYCDSDGIEMMDTMEFSRFINDKELQDICDSIESLHNSYYEFDSHGRPCWFNNASEKENKDKMLNLLEKLNIRLDEINDGTFQILDQETQKIRDL